MEQLKSQPEKSDKKTVTIYINATAREWPKEDISYEEVVAIAFPVESQDPSNLFIVSYERAHGNKDGFLVKDGKPVKVKEDMSFDATNAGRS